VVLFGLVLGYDRAGVDVTFSVFEGADHGDLTHIYKDDELYGWLLEHER
jgi:hypothetical protein